MVPDFEGWATKANLKCNDGRTIMPDAFAHQAEATVPLVWQHGHSDVKNVLGHAILQPRPEGVWVKAYFNATDNATHAKELVHKKDINKLSIWANQLLERSKQVYHGNIREVSLVLSGANPGATIERVSIQHSDGIVDLDDEAIIYTDMEIELKHADDNGSDGEETVEDIYNTLNDKQKDAVHYLIGVAVEDAEDAVEHSDYDPDDPQSIYDSLDEDQQEFLHSMVEKALNENPTLQHSDDQEGSLMHNVFESNTDSKNKTVLSHDDMKSIMENAEQFGSLKRAVKQYASDHLSHGIESIDTLFPDAVNIDTTPQYLARRTEWVGKVLSAVNKRPFARIKTMHADITMEEARAKGYVTGDYKEEEFFSVSKRTTDPTTIYKKQELDRDDVIDITDFDPIIWLKAEMRAMLDEEIARAILLGDGRSFSHKDKVNEGNIRPIASDDELFVTNINVNLADANSSVQELIDAFISHRHLYKGTGTPDLYTKESIIAKFLLLKDAMGRQIYKSLAEVAEVLRVGQIIPVEVMEEYDDIAGIVVNLADYSTGTNAGGNVSMFDDFDIDYNKQKYLIETRLSGALTKLKSAMVLRSVASTSKQAVPARPGFDAENGEVTIFDAEGVIYKNGSGTTLTEDDSPYTVSVGNKFVVKATPAAGYHFDTNGEKTWTFSR